MLDRLTQAALTLSGIGILLMMILIVADVVAKYLFNSPISGVLELVAFYFMTMVVFFPLAYAQKTGQHLVIDLFTRTWSMKNTARLDVLAGIITLIYLSLFFWASTQQAIYMTSINHSAEILNFNLIVWPTLWIIPSSILLMMAWVIHHIHQHLTFLGLFPSRVAAVETDSTTQPDPDKDDSN